MKLVGIDLGGTNVRAGVVDGDHVSGVRAERLLQGASELDVCEQIYAVTDGLTKSDISAIGVGVPSVVDVERGIVYNVQNIPSWKAVPLKERLEQRYGIPVHVNNDANCFAAGEKYFGKGRGRKNVVGLILGTGVGAGLILNHRLYEGTNCGAGEFGMIPYRDSILEAYAGGQFFPRRFQSSGEELALLARGGDPHASHAFEEFGEHVGRAIEIILFSVDPDIVVLGGSVSRSFPLFEKSMWSTLKAFPYPAALQRLEIIPSALEHSAILGAAALYYDSVAGQPTTGGKGVRV